MDAVDFLVVGGGIVGLSTALQVMARYPGRSLALVEKEPRLASHQTGRNSGVIHAGVYYAPGSLKARFCREGAQATIDFCTEHGIAFDRCGKLVVATSEPELAALDVLHARALQNGLAVERLGEAQLRAREPNISGVAAVFVPETGITDYPGIAAAMAKSIGAQGGQVMTGAPIVSVGEDADGVTVETSTRTFRAGHVVFCAGLMADRMARLCGIGADFRIIPFRGEYYRLPERHNGIVRHLIYPVPDPAMPFLGIHLTRMIGGSVTVGPNAVLALAREGYGWSEVSGHDIAEMMGFSGFWRLIARYGKQGATELLNSLVRKRYLAQCRKYCPDLTEDDLLPHPAGVRAQAVMRDGSLVHDFLIRRTRRTTHVCNAPSPAATSAIPIGRYIVDEMAKALGEPSSARVPALG